MKATCPNCSTGYRIDPSKVPPGGIRTRCSRCATVFRIEPEAAAAPIPVPMPTPVSGAALAASAPAAPVAPAAPAAPAFVGEAPAAPSQAPRFGAGDPNGKARRLARALVSDIAVYNPDRRDRGIASGTLRQEFREEIRKSWDEYVGQVGEALARNTTYFRDALNEILAGGRSVF